METAVLSERGGSMSLAKDIALDSAGLTPNPVNVGGVYLVQIGVVETPHIWSDWASSTWADVASMEWGA